MANKKPVPKPISARAKVTSRPIGTAPAVSIFPFTYNIKLIILAVLSIVLYANTCQNEYALDDGIVIEKNQYVQHGFDGIGKIMSTDAYDSYYKEMNAGQQLSGGRYRPLSEVIFAMEHAIFGETVDNSIAMQRHIFSVICYMLAVLAIFIFLSKYLLVKFKYGQDMAFFAAVLFAIHPLHTEVVANVKSLDEILSILFITLTFIFSLRYIDTQKWYDLLVGAACFFLSLLAKEYAITLAVLIPILLYLLRKKSIVQKAFVYISYAVVLIIYLVLRKNAVGFNGHVATNEILDNPYLLATHTQKIATEIFVLGKYLWMLIFPYPLLSDYSYDMIPYRNFSDISVLLTILLYIAGGIWSIWLIYKRNVLAFAVLFYLFCLSLVSNLVMDIGATMGERLIFHSSLGFVILISYGLFELIKKRDLQMKRNLVFGLTALLVIVCGYETIARNFQWKNDITLFTHDVTIGTNSIMLNGNAGARFIDMAQHTKDSITKKHKLDTAIGYLQKSIVLHKRSPYVSSYLNLGDAYYELQMPDSAEVYWKIVRAAYPDYPDLQKYFFLLGRLYLTKAGQYGAQHNYAAATQEVYKALRINPTDASLWYNLGGAYFTWGKYDSAYYAWNKTLQLDPNNADAKKGLSVLVPIKKK